VSISFKRKISARDAGVDIIRSAYHLATEFHQTHATMLARITHAYDSANQACAGHASPWIISFMQGYEKALSEDLYRNHLVFARIAPDGRLYVAQKLAKESEIPNAVDMDSLYGSDVEGWQNWPSHHVWKKSGKVFF
jgi:hypothetical protein